MKTVTVNVYEFDELSEQAKQVALDEFRDAADNTEFNYREARESVKKFNDIFGIKEGSRSWLDCRLGHIDTPILQLKGWRLATYLWNKYRGDLYNGKHYSLWSKKDISFEHYKDGFPVLKSRRSKVILDDCCVLTGVCWDEDLLDPIREFLDKPCEDQSFEELLNECFESLRISLENSSEASTNDENVAEHIRANEIEFTENGQRF